MVLKCGVQVPRFRLCEKTSFGGATVLEHAFNALKGTTPDDTEDPSYSLFTAFDHLSRKIGGSLCNDGLSLEHLIKQLLFHRCPAFCLSDLRAAWRKASNCGMPLRFSTLCSGTDNISWSLALLESILNDELEPEAAAVSIVQDFACDSDEGVRKFIKANSNTAHVFHDVKELVEETARQGVDSEVSTEPPPQTSHLIISGFPCVDSSVCNQKRFKRYREGNIINNTESTTGALFHGVKSFATKSTSCCLLVLENVGGMMFRNAVGRCPMDDVNEELSKSGWSVRAISVDTTEFLLPQTRRRVYWIAVHPGRIGQPVETVERLLGIVHDIVRETANMELMMHPSLFLFPADHQLVVEDTSHPCSDLFCVDSC